eukprot:GFUD01037737.1.p1 GENE.GFUD01037737.1~~GFUD01037737.1.p1  ORF type:complete len:476 (-),score=87.05 GFUD01037737.1:267-1694(-)
MNFLMKTFERRPKDCYIDLLPDEMLLKIFKKLSVRSLCNILLVNKHWRLVGEDPALWKRFPLAIGSQNVKYLPCILKFSRFSHLEELLLMSFDPYDSEDNDIDTAAIVQSSINRLEIRFVDMRANMRNVSMLDTLTCLTIHCCPLTQDQANEMFNKFEEGIHLKQLNIINPLINGTEENIAGDGLSKVSPGAFGRGLSRICSVKLHEVCLTVAQSNSLLTYIDNGSALKSLDIYDSNNPKISESSSELLASSFNKLESLTMYNACLGESRTLNFLQAMAEGTNLKHLNFRSNSLRGIPPTIIARAFQPLISLNIEDTDISPAQSEAFFQSLKENRGKQLTFLSIGHNDLSSVPPEIFAGALKNITKVNINATGITPDQAEALFTVILVNSSLKELQISTNDFSSVNTSLMARAINNLERAFMFYTGLTEQQVEEILQLGLKETNLLHLDLRHNLKKNSPNKLTKYIKSYVDEILL